MGVDLSFHYLGLRDWTQVSGHGDRYVYPLNHPASPLAAYFHQKEVSFFHLIHRNCLLERLGSPSNTCKAVFLGTLIVHPSILGSFHKITLDKVFASFISLNDKYSNQTLQTPVLAREACCCELSEWFHKKLLRTRLQTDVKGGKKKMITVLLTLSLYKHGRSFMYVLEKLSDGEPLESKPWERPFYFCCCLSWCFLCGPRVPWYPTWQSKMERGVSTVLSRHKELVLKDCFLGSRWCTTWSIT